MATAIWRFLLSMRTAFGVLAAAIAACLAGSLVLPANMAFFSGIDDMPLFQWLAGAGRPRLTWWIYGMMAAMGLLAVSTVACTYDALSALGRKNLVLKLSPQLMHLGLLLVLLGHLLTASMGVKSDLLIREGERRPLSEGTEVYLRDLKVDADAAGFDTGWSAELWLYEGGRKVAERVLRPARPVYVGESGLFFRSINMEGEPSALIRVSRDPGALWALFGGVLVALGGIGFVWSRSRP